MSLATLALLFVAGIGGGALSAAAGGASFLTFPALIFAGLSPLAANASNFVALLPAQPTALVTSYRDELRAVRHTIGPSLVTATIGGLAGAALLLLTGEASFSRFVPWLMLLATSMFAAGPRIQSFLALRMRGRLAASGWLCQSFILVFAIYTGYFGAGVGMMLLGFLAAFGYEDIHEANAVKNAVVMASSISATALYGLSGPVAWIPAVTMMAGAIGGAYLGGVISKRAPRELLRNGMIILGLAFTAYLFIR